MSGRISGLEAKIKSLAERDHGAHGTHSGGSGGLESKDAIMAMEPSTGNKTGKLPEVRSGLAGLLEAHLQWQLAE